MEIVRSQRRNGSDGSAGAAALPLYKSAPSLEVRLEEFERCAIDRLRGKLSLHNTFDFVENCMLCAEVQSDLGNDMLIGKVQGFLNYLSLNLTWSI